MVDAPRRLRQRRVADGIVDFARLSALVLNAATK